MKHPQIPLRIYSARGTVPTYAYSLASGCDLFAAIDSVIVLGAMERVLVPTALYIELAPGYEAQLRPRSGKAFKKGLTLPNTPATIDADYRGEILVACLNIDSQPISIEPGEKIAQMVIAPVVQASFIPLASYEEFIGAAGAEDRQGRGFGSSDA